MYMYMLKQICLTNFSYISAILDFPREFYFLKTILSKYMVSKFIVCAFLHFIPSPVLILFFEVLKPSFWKIYVSKGLQA